MRDFISTSLTFQQMFFKAAVSATSQMMEMYLHLYEQQFALLDRMYSYRRPDDPHVASATPKARKRKGRKARSPCSGPDLQDHYGKRAHDVDVEHI